MKSITFTCEVITPMFLAGADGSTPELRPASIKGAMRFWWRAMNGHLPIEDEKNDKGEVIKKGLKTTEAEIFGGSGSKQSRSKISIRISAEKIKLGKIKNNDVKYLAYGAEDRRFIDIGSTFKVHLVFEHIDGLDIAKEIKLAFSLLSYCGGLGAKSRNGFGAFQSNNLIPFAEIIKMPFLDHAEASYTTFSSKCQIYTTNEEFNNWQDLIIGLTQVYKNHGRIRVRKNKRQHIGAPFMIKNITQKPPERHSKIILMSAFQDDNEDTLKGIITYLPYDYMKGSPENGSINLKRDWTNAVLDFLDGIESAQNNEGYLLDNKL